MSFTKLVEGIPSKPNPNCILTAVKIRKHFNGKRLQRSLHTKFHRGEAWESF
ncbi:MAG: hypothetical protein HY965_02480 [Ignavibacteriales bacterium]|nr:hypothetical protein [Ignavibacteriales bacterium]